VRCETQEGQKKVLPLQTPGDVGASSKLVVITQAGIRGGSGRREKVMRLSPHQEQDEMRARVWGSPDVGRAAGCVRMQGTLPGSIWKRGMWRGIAMQVRTHRTHGTQEMRRLRQDPTPTDQTQGPFLLMGSIKNQGNMGLFLF